MVKVAVAGGTGGVGRAIVEALKQQKTHEYIILSRKDNPELSAQLGGKVIGIDYTDVASAKKVLEDNGVHTVISALSLQTQEHGDAQVGLVRAAAAASTVKRFAPSEFGIPYQEKHITSFPIAALKTLAITELKKTDLEWTLFSNGFFADYFGVPKRTTYLQPITIVLDIGNKAAAIPGSGNVPVTFTTTQDVGKFVVASLGLEKWTERTFITGDTKTLNELVAIAEKVTGSKFQVSYDPPEKLQKGEVTELPSHVPVYPFFPKQALQGMLALFGSWFDAGDFNLSTSEGTYLNTVFPEIKPASLEQVITEGWA